jgi:Ca2+-binding RTX toxin-like protein
MGHRARSRRAVALGAVVLVGGAVLSLSGPSMADVSAVSGGAFGYSATVSLFNQPPTSVGPQPTVVLPPAGGGPLTADAASGLAQFGAGIIFSSGPITVSTQGTTGAGGSVTSSASIQNVNMSQTELFTATGVTSTCTASENGSSGSTTITGGSLQTSEGNPQMTGDEVITQISANPAPNTVINAPLQGETFQYIFNEQTINPDGSITVNAVHVILLGPASVGDLYIGQSRCGVTANGVVTTTSSSTTTTVNPLLCNGVQATIVGTDGPNLLAGTAGADVIVGLGGVDRIAGLGGDDVICGGDGNDLITGGEGNDVVLGGAGDDDLVGDAGNDTLNGESGANRLAGGAGTDTCTNGQAAGCEL